MIFALFSVFCATLIGVLTWEYDSYAPQDAVLDPDPANSHYNLLVQGFQSGQLNMKLDAPPEFATLADPYNPKHVWYSGIWANKLGTSYYHGKFYLYFGVTPALVLFWPYAAFTGDYLSARVAVAIFFALGFLIIWWLMSDVRRRYFPGTSFAAFAPGIFIYGLVVCLVLSDWVLEVARVCGFAFEMLALAGIWLALHWPARRNWCLLVASLSYGLAVGSRPSLLFGAIILLAPVLHTWSGPPGAVSRRQMVTTCLSAIIPIAAIGLGLMAYNDLRFDSPFEFGRRYMLTQDYESTTAQQFSLHYLWYDLRYYFFEPISVNAHYPFLQSVTLPTPPSGHAPKYEEFGSILSSYPLIMLIFAVPFIWRGRSFRELPPLGWFMLALFLLFLTCAATDCFLLTAQIFYELDFLPPLILLAFIGFLGLDQKFAHSPGRRRIVRFGWYALLGYSLVFNTLVNAKVRAYSYEYAGNTLLERNQPYDALAHLQNAVSLDPSRAMYHNQLAVAYSKTGDTNAAINELNQALDIDPNCTKAQYNLGSLLYQGGQTNEAFGYFEKALDADPNHTNSLYAYDNVNNAWLLVSNPDPAKRNAPLALKLADAACRETSYKVAQTLVISAAVFGETGRTNEAISLAQKAMVDANQNGDSGTLEIAKSLLARYLKNQPLLPPGRGTVQQK